VEQRAAGRRQEAGGRRQQAAEAVGTHWFATALTQDDLHQETLISFDDTGRFPINLTDQGKERFKSSRPEKIITEREN
jgi:hypothetical protein